MLIARDTNFPWNVSRDRAICNTAQVISHVIRSFISRDIEPEVWIRGFSFILEIAEIAAFANILRTNLKSVMADKKLRVELIVRVPDNIHLVIFAEFRTIRSQITRRIEW